VGGAGVRCWGSDLNGELGDGPTDSTASYTTPVSVSHVSVMLPPGVSVADIALGEAHGCGRQTSGPSYCWGAGANGRLGDGFMMTRTAPVAVTGIVGLLSIAAGRDHTCGRTSTALFCWGRNANGQLGIGSLVDSSSPTAVARPGGDG
jgi:alpha-tubulin suppressor-like RCC1 family protein